MNKKIKELFKISREDLIKLNILYSNGILNKSGLIKYLEVSEVSYKRYFKELKNIQSIYYNDITLKFILKYFTYGKSKNYKLQKSLDNLVDKSQIQEILKNGLDSYKEEQRIFK